MNTWAFKFFTPSKLISCPCWFQNCFCLLCTYYQKKLHPGWNLLSKFHLKHHICQLRPLCPPRAWGTSSPPPAGRTNNRPQPTDFPQNKTNIPRWLHFQQGNFEPATVTHSNLSLTPSNHVLTIFSCSNHFYSALTLWGWVYMSQSHFLCLSVTQIVKFSSTPTSQLETDTLT